MKLSPEAVLISYFKKRVMRRVKRRVQRATDRDLRKTFRSMTELNLNQLFGSRTVVRLVAMVVIVAAGSFCFKKGEVIEKIGDYSLTTGDFNEHYNAMVELMTRMANIDRKKVAKFVCEPRNKAQMGVARNVHPAFVYKNYRDNLMIEQAARREGFADRPVIKKIMENYLRQMLSQLYMQEQMWKAVKITTQQKEKRCEEIRKSHPRLAAMPYDACIMEAERTLTQEIYKTEYPKFIEKVKEETLFKKGDKIDKDEYLKTGIAEYNALKTSGGCFKKPTDSDKKNDKDKKDTSSKGKKKK